MRRLLDEYAKHFSLNIGQALQGMRWVYSHPDIDPVAPRGTVRHVGLSAALRSKRIANDLFFAIIPPHWHHTHEELAAMTTIPAARWFQYGYCAWRFDETGAPLEPLPPDVDERWDPRCKMPSNGAPSVGVVEADLTAPAAIGPSLVNRTDTLLRIVV